MSRIRANTIVNGAGTGAPNFPRGAIISGISTINAEISVGTGTSISSPATNELALGTNSSERIRITSAGLVGIGTTNPVRQLEIFDSSQATLALKSSPTGQSSIWFTDTDDSNIGGVYYEHANDALVMRTNDTEAARFNSSGNLTFPSGKGIDFSATSDGSGGTTTSEILTEYEEGTWSPVLKGESTAGTMSGNVYGIYTRIGRQVSIGLRFENITLTGATGGVIISGLPFPGSGSQAYSTSSIPMLYNISFTTTYIPVFYHSTSGSTLHGLESRSGTTWQTWDVANFLGSTKYIQLSMTYQTV